MVDTDENAPLVAWRDRAIGASITALTALDIASALERWR